MSEHHSDNMFEEDLIPEGLEYQDAFWELALDKIERKEAAIRVRNWSLSGGLAACLAMLVYFGYLHTTPTDAIALNSTQVIVPSRTINAKLQGENEIINAQANTESFVFNHGEGHSSSNNNMPDQGLINNDIVGQSVSEGDQESLANDESGTFSNSDETSNSSEGDYDDIAVDNNENQFSNDSGDDLASTDHSLEGEAVPSQSDFESTNGGISDTDSAENLESLINVDGGNQVEFESEISDNAVVFTNITDENQDFESTQESSSLLTEKAKNLKLELSQLSLSALNPISPEYKYEGRAKNIEGVVIPVSQNEMAFPITPFSLGLKFGSIFKQDYGTLANNFDPQTFISLEGIYSLNRKYFLSTSLGYFSINDIQDLFYSVDSYADLTAHSDTISYSTEKLHYFTVPVNVGIRVKERHQMSLGLGVDIPFAADQTEIVSLNQEFDNSGNNANSAEYINTFREETEKKDVLNKFRAIQYYTQVQYSYAISSGMRIGFTYKYGLSDITYDRSGDLPEYEFLIGDFDRNSFISGFVKFNIVGK